MPSRVHFKRNLIHTCTVERPTSTQSSSGEPIPAWESITTLTRCRYIQKQERVASEGMSLQMQQVDMLLLERATDIIEEDRISDIALYVGDVVVDTGPFTVESVLGRNSASAHHISVRLERIE